MIPDHRFPADIAPVKSSRRPGALRLLLFILPLMAFAAGPMVIPAHGTPTQAQRSQPATELTSSTQVDTPQPPVSTEAQKAINEFIEINTSLNAKIRELTAKVARLNLQLAEVQRKYDDLSQFIKDHDEYGKDFQQYTYFKEQAKAQAAAQARAQREAQRQQQQEERQQQLQQSQSTPEEQALQKRIETVERAGFTRVGKEVFVGEMSYVYETTTHDTVNYNPFIYFWYYNDTKTIDYSKMTVSGTVITAATEPRNISVAIAFFDGKGSQVGSTTVRVDGARPGTPYPFTANVKMTSDGPFKRYSAWVLYDDPVSTPPSPAAAPGSSPTSPPPPPDQMQQQPSQPPAAPADKSYRESGDK